MRKCSYLLLIFIAFITYPAVAQKADPHSKELTLKEIFKEGAFRFNHFGPSKWIDGGAGYTTLERNQKEGGEEIVRYESAGGAQKVLITAKQLTPKGDANPLSISDYEWSGDKLKLLIFTNTARVWRYNTRGDYWVLNLETNKLQKLGGQHAKPSTLMFAKFSPSSNRVAYVREHNLYVENLSTGKITALTSDGTENIINGTFDWAYEEEFSARDGFRWSPDGKRIAYWQLDASGIRDFLLINNTDSLYAFTKPVQYPKVGTTPSSCKVGVISSSGGKTTWMKVPGNPHQHYIPRMKWAASSNQIILQQLNRKQNTNKLILGNVSDGSTKTIFTDTDAAWVEVVNDWKWYDDGQKLTWVSEKDGWRHVYSISRDGQQVTKLTPWAFDVISIQNIDTKNGWLYYIASPDNPTQRYLYRSRLDGNGQSQRLSPENKPGTHSYNISPNAKWAIHTYSKAGTPPTVDLVQLPDHRTDRILVANKKLKKRVAHLTKQPITFFRTTAGDSVKLDSYIMKPTHFDSTKKYPVLFHVYGEPAGQTVLDRWGGSTYLWHLFLTQHGYIVMSVDNHGTPAPRGRYWRKSIYGQIGILASKDQAAATCSIMNRFSFVDSSRIGIWGWSGGGSMTLNMMFRYPEIYKTGMSVAPVADQYLYDNIYQERYMGLPSENKEGYRKGSPITYAKNLKGNLLIVHGTGDDNVHFQNTERLINELIRQNKLFSVMIYPNRTHGIYEGKNTSLHLRETLYHYLKTHLKPGVE